jgi:succinate dehydrogenase/fumarate reductase flavoprotein subunit
MKVEQEVDGVKTEVDGPVLAYLVMIDEAVKAFPNLRFYSGKGYVSAYSQISELAEGIKVPEKNLRAALNAFNECYNRQGSCNDPFGRTDFSYPTRESDMFHVMMVTPAIHYTMGGLEIDSDAHVLRAVASAGQEEGAKEEEEEKEVIPGLFAAGEVTGGVHGGNRLAGNSLLECVVFGRIAGRAAAAVPPAPTTAAAAATPAAKAEEETQRQQKEAEEAEAKAQKEKEEAEAAATKAKAEEEAQRKQKEAEEAEARARKEMEAEAEAKIRQKLEEAETEVQKEAEEAEAKAQNEEEAEVVPPSAPVL